MPPLVGRSAAIACLLAAGCGELAAALPVAAAPPPLGLAGPADVGAGELLTLALTGADPGATCTFLAATGGLGAGDCPPRLGGACLDILAGRRGYRALATVTAAPDGSAVLSVPVPVTAPLGAWQAQVACTAPTVALSPPISFDIVARCNDALEPNDRPPDAAPLTGDTLDLAVCTGGDVDWFEVLVPAGSTMSVQADFDSADGDLDLELYSPAGVRVDGAYTLTAPELLLWLNDDPVDQLMQVVAFTVTDPQRNGVRYDLQLDLIAQAPCVADADEPDDLQVDALPATPGVGPARSACDSDLDWTWIDLAAGEALAVTADHPRGDGAVEVQLYGAAGAPLTEAGRWARYATAVDERVWIATSLAYDDLAGLGNTYALDVRVQVASPCTLDALEPNDRPRDAAPLAPGAYPDLQLCADLDVYAVTAAPGETIEVTATYAAADGNVDLQLIEPGVGTVASGADTDDDDVVTWTSVAGGTYTVIALLVDDPAGPVLGGAAYALEVSVR